MLSKTPIQHYHISIYTHTEVDVYSLSNVTAVITIERINEKIIKSTKSPSQHQPYTPSCRLNIQSSDRKFLTINTLVHVRTTSATTAMGKKMQLTTINLVPWYSGLTKLDVLPGGGGMAGVIWESAILLSYLLFV